VRGHHNERPVRFDRLQRPGACLPEERPILRRLVEQPRLTYILYPKILRGQQRARAERLTRDLRLERGKRDDDESLGAAGLQSSTAKPIDGSQYRMPARTTTS